MVKGEFIPRWVKRERTKTVPQCCVPGCSAVSDRACSFASFDTICGACDVACGSTGVSGPSSYTLCSQHFHIVYKYCNPEHVVACALCGSKRSHHGRSQRFFSVPEPQNITCLLREAGGFEECLTESSVACNACRLFCRRLLEQSDEDLRPPQTIVESLQLKVSDLKERLHQCMIARDHCNVDLLHTAVFLGEHMLSDQAILFPQLYQVYSKGRSTPVVAPLPKYKVLVFVGKEFGDLLSSISPSKRVGRILYRAKCDPFMMLSHALGAPKAKFDGYGGARGLPVEQVIDHLNQRVHELSAQLLKERDEAPVGTSAFDLDQFHTLVPRELWDAVNRLTFSTSEKHGRKHSDTHAHGRKVRIAYLICVLMYCATGGHCSVPLHTVLSDFIEASGGSSEIITVLNRLGAVASRDTLDRHIVNISTQRKAKGLLMGLKSNVFTVATTDNIDFLQSGASVYVGNQSRSWHGTSVQVVQPQQRLIIPVVQPQTHQTSMLVSPPRPLCTTAVSTSPSDSIALNRELYVQRPRTSPISSPSGQCCSPAYKRKKWARTFIEGVRTGKVAQSDLHNVSMSRPHTIPRHYVSLGHLSFNDFQCSAEEETTLTKLKCDFLTYVIHKYALQPDHSFMSFKDHIAAVWGDSVHAEPADIVYLSIVDMNADTIEAMSEVAAMLHKEYIATTGAQHLIVAGDAKTYLRLKELKQEYGTDLDWLLPFLGDWHVLFNYQKALMKVYYEVGLKYLAKASGFKAETLTSLANSSNFKRTHAFLLQVWEVLYRYMFEVYRTQCSPDITASEAMLEVIRDRLLQCNEKCKADCTFRDYVEASIATESECAAILTGFMSFVSDLSSKNDTWKFWHDFVFHDCLAYIGLYFAIRGGMWNLRMASLKEMCPLFTVFDRLNYMKILPQHFSEVISLPERIKECFISGGFVCNIRGKQMHAVALDEAHEMLVNKDIKTSVVRPSKEYLEKIMYYFPVRSALCKQLVQQISLPTDSEKEVTIFDSTPHALRCEENIMRMLSMLGESHVLDPVHENRALIGMDGTIATPEQHRDLMSFRDIGQQYSEAYVKYYILRDPSAPVPLRKRRLQVFGTEKRSKKHIKQKEREQKLVSRCLRCQLAWSAQTGSVLKHQGEQYLELPRAICTPRGVPQKGQKSYATKYLEKRYCNLIVSMFPGGWVSDSVVLEGMFLINTAPLVTHSLMKDYVLFMVRRFAVPHFAKGVKEVHIVFDRPAGNLRTPKAFEQSRRDTQHSVSLDHEHCHFSDDASIPHKWREYLNCRHCKQQLVKFLGEALLTLAQSLLLGEQKLVVSGCYERGKAMGITNSGVHECCELLSNAEESDTRVWMHVVHSAGMKKLLFSPDTDVYHIGLSLDIPAGCDIYVQLSSISSPELRLLHFNNLLLSLAGDPDLALVPPTQRPRILQTLFICSGCDYVSFFVGLGKATIMRHFFENAFFITGTREFPGTLADSSPGRESDGFLSFVRLIGCVYFKKHLAEFIAPTPRSMYTSLTQSGLTPVQQHKQFIELIRETVWSRIQFEDELPPSFAALWRHWLRTCWVSNMWSQARQSHINLLDLTTYGWKVVEGKLECDWESPQNQAAVRERVGLLFRGCSCSSVAACSTRRCSCMKKGVKCGPGCRCRNCSNAPSATTSAAHLQVDVLQLEEEELVQDDFLRRECGEELVIEDNSSTSELDDEEDTV